ncbi:MAG: BamA/TamA family outer membrane protein, partial [bacterium]
PLEKLNNPLEYLDQVFSIGLLQQTHLLSPSKSVLISPDPGHHLSADFSSVADLINKGEKAALPRIDEIKREIEIISKSNNALFAPQNLIIEGLPDSLIKAGAFSSLFKLEIPVPEYVIQQTVDSLYCTGNYKQVKLKITRKDNQFQFNLFLQTAPVISHIQFLHNMAIISDTLSLITNKFLNNPLNYIEFHDSLKNVLEKYRSAGYQFADIDSLFFSENGTCSVYINEGRVTDIQVKGNQTSRPHIIIREFPLKKGDILSKSLVMRGIEDIYSTGFFNNIYVSTEKYNHGIRVVIDVDEKGFDIFQTGARYDNVRKGEGYVRYITDNLLGLGYNIAYHIQYGAKREKYYISLGGNRFLNTYLTFNLKSYYFKDKVVSDTVYQKNGNTVKTTESSYLRKIGFLFSFGQQLLRLGTISYNFMLENYRTSRDDLPWEKESFVEYKNRIRNISLCFDMENFNRMPFPERGQKLHISLDYAKDVFGASENYSSLTNSLSSYFTFYKRNTLNLQYHISMGDRFLRESQRKYLGGISTMRINDELSIYKNFPFMGFKELEKSGDYLAILSLAYRLKIINILYFSAQYDIGNAWLKHDFNTKLSEFRASLFNMLEHGYGLKFSADLKNIGPAELVFSTNGRKSIADGNLYFSIGYNF